jgi:hypothetical protein
MQEDFFELVIIQRYYYNASPVSPDYPFIVCLSLLISYIKEYVHPRKQMEHYASIYAFVKNFMKCDSISTVRQTAVVRLATDQCCAKGR